VVFYFPRSFVHRSDQRQIIGFLLGCFHPAFVLAILSIFFGLALRRLKMRLALTKVAGLALGL